MEQHETPVKEPIKTYRLNMRPCGNYRFSCQCCHDGHKLKRFSASKDRNFYCVAALWQAEIRAITNKPESISTASISLRCPVQIIIRIYDIFQIPISWNGKSWMLFACTFKATAMEKWEKFNLIALEFQIQISSTVIQIRIPWTVSNG